MLEELNRVISQARVGERLEDLERISTFNYEKSHVKRGHETDIYSKGKSCKLICTDLNRRWTFIPIALCR